jgi:hypothetical protein
LPSYPYKGTELKANICHNLLAFPGFNYQSENSAVKSRVAMYINSDLKYVRPVDLEESGCHIIVIDVLFTSDLRIINPYRSFNPNNGESPRNHFKKQLNLIIQVITSNIVAMRDFNLE